MTISSSSGRQAHFRRTQDAWISKAVIYKKIDNQIALAKHSYSHIRLHVCLWRVCVCVCVKGNSISLDEFIRARTRFRLIKIEMEYEENSRYFPICVESSHTHMQVRSLPPIDLQQTRSHHAKRITFHRSSKTSNYMRVCVCELLLERPIPGARRCCEFRLRFIKFCVSGWNWWCRHMVAVAIERLLLSSISVSVSHVCVCVIQITMVASGNGDQPQ